jgi:hypothetical protein
MGFDEEVGAASVERWSAGKKSRYLPHGNRYTGGAAGPLVHVLHLIPAAV